MTAKSLIAVLLLFATPAWADVVRIEVKSRADVLAGQAFGAAGPYEKLVRHAALRGRPAKPGQPDHHRHRQGAEERRGPRGVLVGLLPDQAEGPGTRQRHAALRGVEPRRQGHARVLQLRDRQPRSRGCRRVRRRLSSRAGVHAALGRLAVRPADARGPRPCVRRRSPARRTAAPSRAGAERLRGDRGVEAGVARRPRSPGLRRGDPRRPCRRPHGPRLGGRRTPDHPACRVAVRRGWQERAHGRWLPAEEDLRGRLHRPGSAGGWRGPGRRARHGVAGSSTDRRASWASRRAPSSAPSRSASRRAAGSCARISTTGSTKTRRTARCSTA